MNAQEPEEWRSIPGHESYQVSSHGRWRRKYEKRDGYTYPRSSASVPLRKDGKPASRLVTILVREVFGVRRPTYSDQYAHLLGVVPDREAGEIAGVSRKAIQQWRKARGIAPVGIPGTHRVRRDLLVAPVVDRLGKESDDALAKETGIPLSSIVRARRDRKIPGYERPGGVGSRGHSLNQYRHLLGVETDAVIAEKAGVSSVLVCLYRQRLGIARAPYVRRKRSGP